MNDYNYWHKELKEPQSQERDTNEHIAGFWRIKAAKTKPDYPVAIWYVNNEQQLAIGRQKPNAGENDTWFDFIGMTFPKCEAITEQAYKQALETGFWSDGKPARKMDDNEKMGIDVSRGGNNPPIEESIADQIKNLADIAKDIPEPKTQEEANKATVIVDKLRGLWKVAEATRIKEKAPHDEAGKAVQAKWLPIMLPAKEEGVALDKRRKAFLLKEQKRLDDERAEKQRIANEEAKKETERLQAIADAKAKEEGAGLAEKVEVAPVTVEEVKATAGGDFGRNSGLRKTRVGVIVDFDKFIAAIKDAPDFIEFLDKKAQSAARSQIALDGLEIKEVLK